MELLFLLLPFFLLGLAVAGISRISGVAMSMIIVPALLIWGATPLDVISFMLLFVLYNNFTVATQNVRLDFKSLTFFPKWKALIPVLITLALTFTWPAAGVAFFIACFILEISTVVYKGIPSAERPATSEVTTHIVLASVLAAVGALLVPFISSDIYFGLAGLAILVLTGFAWYAGEHRDAFRGTWGYIWTIFNFFLGAFGVEASYYPSGLTRTFTSKLDSMIPIITVVAGFAGIMVVFTTQEMFSIPAFVAALGAAIGVRLFGVYEFSKRGSFSYLAIAVAVLAVISLYLVSPVPFGFEQFNTLLEAPAQ